MPFRRDALAGQRAARPWSFCPFLKTGSMSDGYSEEIPHLKDSDSPLWA